MGLTTDQAILAFFALVCCILFFVCLLFVTIFLLSHPYPEMVRFESEEYYYLDLVQKKKKKFHSLYDPAEVKLSVIVPAYNEENRLPVMMDECLEYLENRQKSDAEFTYEVIIVDDGSKDSTTETGLKYSEQFGAEKVKVLTFVKNRGKGGAVRMGVLSSSGREILFADADGATKFSDYSQLESELSAQCASSKTDMAIVCGSRAHLQEESIAERSIFRTVLMFGFHFLVWFLCVKGVKDTQCGFKLFTREAARQTFPNLHIERWAFDVELLYIAQQLNIPIGEVAVTWHEIDGSKITPFWSWLQMGRDLLLIRVRYLIGAWKLKTKQE